MWGCSSGTQDQDPIIYRKMIGRLSEGGQPQPHSVLFAILDPRALIYPSILGSEAGTRTRLLYNPPFLCNPRRQDGKNSKKWTFSIKSAIAVQASSFKSRSETLGALWQGVRKHPELHLTSTDGVDEVMSILHPGMDQGSLPYLPIASSSLMLKPSTQNRIRRRPCRIRQVRHHSPSRATASSPFAPVAAQLGKNGFINGSGNAGTSTIIGTRTRSPTRPRLWNIVASWRRWSSIGVYRLYTLCEDGGCESVSTGIWQGEEGSWVSLWHASWTFLALVALPDPSNMTPPDPNPNSKV